MSIKQRLQRLQRVHKAAEPVQITVYRVVTPDAGGGVDYDGKHLTLAEWEQHKAEFKRTGGQVIEVTPESIARRTGGL